MRVLFTSSSGQGHLQPMLPLAAAVAGAGHSVAVAVSADLCNLVDSAVMTAMPAGASQAQWLGELQRRHPGKPWCGLSEERILPWFVPRLFGEIAAPAMVADLLRIDADWEPELVVHETFELAGPVAARRAGIPSVHHTVGPPLSDEIMLLAASSTAPLWHQCGLDAIAVAGDGAALRLDIWPPSMGVHRDSRDVPSRALRPVPAAPPGAPSAWLDDANLDRGPVVHATLGTSATSADQSVLATVIAGLRDLPLTLVVTVGPAHDPAELGPQPDNVRVERYIPHAVLLPRCSLVVSHGGAGTTLAALGCGLPLLTLPQSADQYVIAETCDRRGVGRTLRPGEVVAARVRSEVRLLLEGGSYSRRAREVAAEIEAMPSPQESVSALAQLCAAAVPMRGGRRSHG